MSGEALYRSVLPSCLFESRESPLKYRAWPTRLSPLKLHKIRDEQFRGMNSTSSKERISRDRRIEVGSAEGSDSIKLRLQR